MATLTNYDELYRFIVASGQRTYYWPIFKATMWWQSYHSDSWNSWQTYLNNCCLDRVRRDPNRTPSSWYQSLEIHSLWLSANNPARLRGVCYRDFCNRPDSGVGWICQQWSDCNQKKHVLIVLILVSKLVWNIGWKYRRYLSLHC